MEMLLAAYSVEQPSMVAIVGEAAKLVQGGDSSQAKFFLDGLELRFGPWEDEQLAVAHLLVLLCENDLHSARFLCKRTPKLTTTTTTAAGWPFQVYEMLWRAQYFSAQQVLNSPLVLSSSSELIQQSAQLLLAKIRARQVAHVQKVYSKVSVADLGRILGLSTPQEVARLCEMSPDLLFTMCGDFVTIAAPPATPANTADTADHIAKLAQIIAHVQSEFGTFVTLK
ncbi:hypothetical protein BASA81_000645 [Batrachochytrium salamandrivorans]|nr:hypothetical protein BASA81_000645 [Batrachochytrium salamandrivorans]